MTLRLSQLSFPPPLQDTLLVSQDRCWDQSLLPVPRSLKSLLGKWGPVRHPARALQSRLGSRTAGRLFRRNREPCWQVGFLEIRLEVESKHYTLRWGLWLKSLQQEYIQQCRVKETCGDGSLGSRETDVIGEVLIDESPVNKFDGRIRVSLKRHRKCAH